MFSDSVPTSNNIFVLKFYLLLEVYHLIVERRFARRSDPENHAGGSVSSW
jgi:hypothetical protein